MFLKELSIGKIILNLINMFDGVRDSFTTHGCGTSMASNIINSQPFPLMHLIGQNSQAQGKARAWQHSSKATI